MKAIVESFEGSGILVNHVKVSLQTTGLATKLFKIKDYYECQVKLVETTECAILEAMRVVQELNFKEDNCSIKRYFTKRTQNNDNSKIMNVQRPNISVAVYS